MSEAYIENIKREIENFNKKQITLEQYSEKLGFLNRLIKNNRFDFNRFLKGTPNITNNKEVSYSTLKPIFSLFLTDEEEKEFNLLVRNLSNCPEGFLTEDSKFDNIEKSKDKLKDMICSFYIKIQSFKVNKVEDIDRVLNELDGIIPGKDVNVRLIVKTLRHVGFDSEKIDSLLCYIGQSKIDFYIDQMAKLNEKAKETREKQIEAARKKEIRRKKRYIKENCLNNLCSIKTRNLFEQVREIIKNNLRYDDSQIILARSYMPILDQDYNEFLNLFSTTKEASICLINIIKLKMDDINYFGNELTEEELKIDIDKLEELVNNYNKLLKTDLGAESFYMDKANENNLYYLKNENNGLSYVDISKKSLKDANYRRSIDSAISKLQSNTFNKNKIIPIAGIDNGKFFVHNKICLGYIKISDNNYIVLTADSHDKFFSNVENIYNLNIEQIGRIKTSVLGRKVD